MKCMPSFIKIGGAVSEKNGKTRHTFVVLYIGCNAAKDEKCTIEIV